MTLWKSKQILATHLGISEVFTTGALTESGVLTKLCIFLTAFRTLHSGQTAFIAPLAPNWMLLTLLLICFCVLFHYLKPLSSLWRWYMIENKISFFALKLNRNWLNTSSVSYYQWNWVTDPNSSHFCYRQTHSHPCHDLKVNSMDFLAMPWI